MLLAVSGGADSMALLEGAVALGGRVGVASLDHGLRPESSGELEHVAARAAHHGLPFFQERLSLSQGPNLEARAREARYAALEAIRAREGYDLIATAHTADDQAETVLMRLLRGSRLRGAGAIRARSGKVVRPMLGCRRQEARAFLEEQNLPFVRDPMNVDRRFLRVRVREVLLPALKELGGEAAIEHLATFAHDAHEDEQLLLSLAGQARERLAVEGGLDAVGLRALEPPVLRRVLRAELEQRGVRASTGTLRSAIEALEQGHAELARGLSAESAGGVFRLHAAVASPPARVELDPHGATFGRWTIGVGANVPREATWEMAVRDVPLACRARQPGDRIRRGQGHQKLQDLLVNAKVPRELRGEVPVVVTREDEVIAVVGLWPSGNSPGPGDVYLWAYASRAGDGPEPAL